MPTKSPEKLAESHRKQLGSTDAALNACRQNVHTPKAQNNELKDMYREFLDILIAADVHTTTTPENDTAKFD